MDDEERQRMAENGEESEEYQKFLQQPSGNMDDSGYFSVQVISSALDVWGLELVPLTSTDARIKPALSNPSQMKAFICNYKDHWFTIRCLGNQWFNLNSLLTRPELISDTYLSLFLAQLKNDGYSIFVVIGELPDCEADNQLRLNPVAPTALRNVQHTKATQQTEEDSELQAALKLSMSQESCGDTDYELEQALRLSMQQRDDNEDDEDALLRKAIDMSLQC